MEGFDNIKALEGTNPAPQPPVSAQSAIAKSRSESAAHRELIAREPVEITLRSLLAAGVHFGHQTSRWEPKMAPYIHSVKNGIHIINLPQTLQYWQAAREAVVNCCARGGNVLFVGTKKQAQDIVIEEARRCGAFYVSHRWLGGMLTNFQTIRRSIERMKKVEMILNEEEKILTNGIPSKYTKKERLMMTRELEKLEYSLGGIKEMYRVPDLIFVIDVRREDISVQEAQRLDIPVVALVDTNCDPRNITYVIPSHDDGSRAIKIFTSAISDAVSEGRKIMKERGVTVNEKPEVAEDPKIMSDKSFGSHKFDSSDKEGENSNEPL